MKKCITCKIEKDVSEFHKHPTSKDGLQGKCKCCMKLYKSKRYENNKDKILKQRSEYYEANKKRILEQQSEYYEANKRCIAEQRSEYYENNKEQILEQKSNYRKNNPDKIREMNSQYYDNNIQKIREYYKTNKDSILERRSEYYKESPKSEASKMQSRAKRLGLLHPDCDSSKVAQLIQRKRDLNETSDIEYEIDHIYPLALGGCHHENNIQIIPRELNNKKSNLLDYRHPDVKSWEDLPKDILDYIEQHKLAALEAN